MKDFSCGDLILRKTELNHRHEKDITTCKAAHCSTPLYPFNSRYSRCKLKVDFWLPRWIQKHGSNLLWRGSWINTHEEEEGELLVSQPQNATLTTTTAESEATHTLRVWPTTATNLKTKWWKNQYQGLVFIAFRIKFIFVCTMSTLKMSFILSQHSVYDTAYLVFIWFSISQTNTFFLPGLFELIKILHI